MKIKNRSRICLIISGSIILIALLLTIFGHGINLGLDFTGSTHCMITPYWCSRLGKKELVCFQASERTGILYTGIRGNRVKVAGKAVLYSEGMILEG